jgi:hypothetical protein
MDRSVNPHPTPGRKFPARPTPAPPHRCNHINLRFVTVVVLVYFLGLIENIRLGYLQKISTAHPTSFCIVVMSVVTAVIIIAMAFVAIEQFEIDLIQNDSQDIVVYAAGSI